MDAVPSLELPALRQAYVAWSWEVAWSWPPHSVVYRLTHADGQVRYLKLARSCRYPSLADEAARMRWARAHLPVPQVLDCGEDGGIEWLVTSAIPGRDATDPELLARPAELVAMLGRGLRAFHDDAPVADCPFDSQLDTALRHARRRVETGRVDPERDFHPEHAHLSAAEALARLESSRPLVDELVVCHGDYCFPNAIVRAGRVAGFVDLGELGVADRWWDLAVATWSTTWNAGPGWEDAFLEAYGIEPDPARTAWYRLLYDLAS